MARELVHVVDAACATHAALPAVMDSERTMSYGHLSEEADAIAVELRAAGAMPNELVTVMVANRALDFAAFLGIWRAGCVAAPLNRATPALALLDLISRSRTRFVVDASPDMATRWAIDQEGSQRWAGDRVLAHTRCAFEPREILNDAAFVIFTSGSTGHPKGVVSTHGAWAGKLDAIDSVLHFGCDVRVLLTLQITFAFGIWVSLLTLTRGGTVVVHERYDPKRVASTLAAEAITHIAMVPTMMRAFMARLCDQALRSQVNLVNSKHLLRQILTGGESLGENLNRAMLDVFPGVALYDVYGLTETTTSDFFLMPEDQPRYFGCIGRPSPGVRYRIANERGEQVAHGESGELQILSPFIMRGYLDEPHLTAAAFVGNWFRTGDIGQTHESGVVQLKGRAKELISRGAVKISPIEIEQIFGKHPGVAEALVTGIPDTLMGERIHILLIPKADATLSEDELRAWAQQWLNKNRVPDVFHFGSALPLGRTGKADRGRMREIVTAGGNPGR